MSEQEFSGFLFGILATLTAISVFLLLSLFVEQARQWLRQRLRPFSKLQIMIFSLLLGASVTVIMQEALPKEEKILAACVDGVPKYAQRLNQNKDETEMKQLFWQQINEIHPISRIEINLVSIN